MTEQSMQSNEASQQPEPAQSPQGRSDEPTQESVTTRETEGNRLTDWLRSPAKAGTVVGGVVLGAAALIGPLEAAVGAGAAYAAYRVVQRRGWKERKGAAEAEQKTEQQEPNAA